MTDATTKFFRTLEERGHDPLLGRATGTLRFDLTDTGRTERWLVTIGKGTLAVSRRHAKADCVVKADKRLFDRLASGDENAFAAILRGALRVEGDRSLLLPFQRLFPGPPRAS